jgi:hypothetical protein
MSSLNKSYESGHEHSDVAPQREVTLNHTAVCDARESSQASPSPLLTWSKKLVEIIQRFGINFGEVFSSERSFLHASEDGPIRSNHQMTPAFLDILSRNWAHAKRGARRTREALFWRLFPEIR